MSSSRTSLLIAFVLSAGVAAPALAGQPLRYATDPDPAVWNEVMRDHATTFGHHGIMLPRTNARDVVQPGASDHYATDPDYNVWNEVKRDHMTTFSHPDVMLPRSRAVRVTAGAAPASATDPDAGVRSSLDRDVRIQ